MTEQELNARYGALYPYTKLPPCETADGVPFEFGMTLWWWTGVDASEPGHAASYQTAARDELVLVPAGPKLFWRLGDWEAAPVPLIGNTYSTREGAIQSRVAVLERQIADLQAEIDQVKAQ